MRLVAASAAIAGVTVGVLFNGHGTQTIGAYLVLVAVVWLAGTLLFLLAWPRLAARMQRNLEREIPSKDYADWFVGDTSYGSSDRRPAQSDDRGWIDPCAISPSFAAVQRRGTTSPVPNGVDESRPVPTHLPGVRAAAETFHRVH